MRQITKLFSTRPFFYLVLSVSAILILFSRRPKSFLNPQFWAEDGREWYVDAYHLTIFQSLTLPENGYYQTFSRLAALIAQIFPLSYGPVIFLALAVAVQVIVALFIASDRMASLIPSKNWRIFLAFMYLAVPHSAEVFVNVTNSQWHLALLGCLVIVAAPSEKTGWKIFDVAAIALMSLSGPFCILLLPIVVIRYITTRRTNIALLAGMTLVGSIIQFSNYFFVGREIKPQLGASIDLLFQILGRHVFIGPLFGHSGFQKLAKLGLWGEPLYILATFLGIASLVFVFYKASSELRLLLGFALLIIAAGLYTPAVSRDAGQWASIANSETATRYWFILTFSFAAVFIYFASTADVRWLKRTAYVGIFCALLGVAGDWKIFSLHDLNFQQYAREFENVPVGTEYVIPLNPQPEWEMKLIKK